MKMSVVFSRRDAEWFSPPHAPERRYLIAPLTFRERQAFRADLARDGGIYPPQAQMLEALRLAITRPRPAMPRNSQPRLRGPRPSRMIRKRRRRLR
jgi:hypothetical protein